MDDAAEKTHTWNSYATPSCTTDGKYVYAFFGTPGLFCYDFEGKLIWHHSFGVFTDANGWGIGASPFVYEDLVIMNCDNDGAAGLRPEQRDSSRRSHGGDCPGESDGERRHSGRTQHGPWLQHAVVAQRQPRSQGIAPQRTRRGLWAYDPASGKELWYCERPPTDQMSKYGEPLPVFGKDAALRPRRPAGDSPVHPARWQRRH